MTDRQDARERAVEQLVHPPASTFEWRSFASWAEDHRLVPYPAAEGSCTGGSSGVGTAKGTAKVTDRGRSAGELSGERLLLRYLHVNHESRGWSATYARRLSGIIARVWVSAGHPDPRGERWTAYLRGLERVTASPATPSSGFTEAEVLRLAPAVLAAATPTMVHTVAATVLADAVAHKTPRPFAELKAILARVDIGDVSPERLRRVATLEWPRALARLTRAPMPTKAVPAREAFDTWWEGASPAHRALVVRSCGDRELSRRTQDLAYFYTGLTFGSRFAEASRLRIGWLRRQSDAIVATIPANQHKGGLLAAHHGKRPHPLEVVIPHANGHPAHCPACRLQDHLDIRAMSLGIVGRDSRVFVTSRGTPLTLRCATGIINRLFAVVADDPADSGGRRIGTRSVRVTTATLAREKGLSLVDIAELGNWRQVSTAQRYIRHHDPRVDDDLVLATVLDAEHAPVRVTDTSSPRAE